MRPWKGIAVAKCSYAQNCEDVLLARIFPESSGFYIDIGAADPVELSVTKYFYDLGWSGLNVEPLDGYFDKLVAQRSRDQNLRAAISDRPGTLTLYVAPTHPGWSTTDVTVAQNMRTQGIAVHPTEVPAVTLAEVCERYVQREITFLKIDVEGAEKSVLASGDFRRWRPRVVLLEATEQGKTTPNHQSWEHYLLDADYSFATFDGLNRYYVRQEDAEELIPPLQVPVNVFDDWYPYEYMKQIVALQAEVADQRRTAVAYANQVSQQRQTIDSIRARLEDLKRFLRAGIV
jgi:FkbM family methyltransferase